ncbi:class I SAM-dependent methyltransferase [Phenylobacterium terrae]|uniref:Class I SAM-dependent methyltransferase n=1 Tax=Phenylobacterium terrae TaxID=2665495 RepID=A0ABW4MYV6_9CAUL
MGVRRLLVRLLGGAPPANEADRRREFALSAFRNILQREPTPDELEHWARTAGEIGPGKVLDLMFGSDEFQHRNRVARRSEFYAGHFYSPVVDPEALAASGFSVDRDVPPSALPGLAMDPDRMVRFWDEQLPAMRAADFPEEETPGRRYYARNDLYSWGDAYVLAAMLAAHRPGRIVEIGSGFSSACMLDLVDAMGLSTAFTFVEPYADRLKGLLTEADRARCTLLEVPVQATGPELYEALGPGDVLFIDSTHVSKAGSDVNFELFEILPRLKPGVVVHVHDIFYPFEYPEDWIFRQRRSWNEAYALRAFLAFNSAFEILFFNDYFGRHHADHARATLPRFLDNPGGGLWLRKTA